MKEPKKIVLIGPVYPYKGGISHYTSLMYSALKAENDVYMMSYSMQYPRFLYKKEQKDFSNDAFKIETTDYAIHTANPFNWIKTAGRIREMAPDFVVIQWWHPYFAPCYFMLCKLLKKIPVLFICHNVFPHERFVLDRFLTKLVLRRGSSFIVQSSQDETDLLSIKPDAHYIKTVHPTYNVFKLQNLTKEQGREELQIDPQEKVLLFFGFVREYKGLKYLLQAMPQVIKGLEHVRLMVVGDFAGDKEEYLELISALNIESYVEIHDGYIPDQEVEKFFASCDLVVLPYKSATQSGIVQIAYGFEKPVIVTNVGGLPEVVPDGRTGYVVEPLNSKAIADKIIQFFAEDKAAEFAEAIEQEAYKYSWERMAENIEKLTSHGEDRA